MGFLNALERRKRIKKAAEEMWHLVRSGYNFELPLSFMQDDLAVQATVELMRNHPGVEMRFYQSRGLVLGLFGKGQGGLNVDESLRDYLKRSGHLKSAEGRDLTVENFLAQHEAFLVQQKLDPREMEREAQEKRMAEEAISIARRREEASLEENAPSTAQADPASTPAPLDSTNASENPA
jgi:hypothetical protein